MKHRIAVVTSAYAIVAAVLVLGIVLASSGCCTDVKARVAQFGKASQEQAVVTLRLVDQCKAGNQPMCDAAKASVQAQADAAKVLQSATGGAPVPAPSPSAAP